jgi:SAM-dependent methyltransferase
VAAEAHQQGGTPEGPYSEFAFVYDTLLGRRFFPHLRRVMDLVLRRHSIRLDSVADVACGTGTLVRWLCDRGARVAYGVDASPQMLEVALTKNRGRPARFLLQSFATLELPRPVGLVTCTFDGLNYLRTPERLLAALRRFRTNLVPGGHVVFDMVTDRPPDHGSIPRMELAQGPGITVVRVSRWDPLSREQTAHVVIVRGGRRHHELHVQRGYPVALVLRLLATAGLTPAGVYDFETLGPTSARTKRTLFVAQYLLPFPLSAKMDYGRGGSDGPDPGGRYRRA